MSLFARFRAIQDNDKSALVRKLMQNSTPDFDYFYLIGLSILMATAGLLLNSGSIVIGSMLIAPLMYPILAVALGLVMSNYEVLRRSTETLIRSLGIGLLLSVAAAFLLTGTEPDSYRTAEVMSRANGTNLLYLYLLVSIVAGAAVSYILARPEWGATLPGTAIAVALIPPLAALGIGIAHFDVEIIKGTTLLLIVNLFGIIGSAMVVFLLMNLSEKGDVAESTIKREQEKAEKEKRVIEEVTQELNGHSNTTVDSISDK